MGLIDWIGSWFGKRSRADLKSCFYEASIDYFFKKLAVNTCVDLIANTLVRCEFQTFEKGKEVRKGNHYLFNVQPNQNQNASQFMHSLVSHLIYDNECLVIMHNDQLYIADSFSKEEFALKENIYKGVTVKNFTFTEKVFKESEVFYFQLNDENIMNVIDGLYSSWGKLITSATSIYKRSNAMRVVVKGEFLRAQTPEIQQQMDAMFNEQFKAFFEADNAGAVFQLQDGYTLENFSNTSKGNKLDSRDIKALVDDIIDFVSMAFHVPKGMLKGDVVDVSKQTDNFLMFCINPLVELIADEINRKFYKKEEYLERTYLKVDTSRIKYVDITQLASACDVFFRIGANSINDILRMLGREPINEEWANKRYVTKNYESVENAAALGGGDENDSNGNSENQKSI
ncbi:phage portal protein [Bacillus cereus group sp. N21]|uniref:phage portal protein n=1 Tax=Bacillus cereus group sp. N21 TaxID=2794591 RepID=UPI0018F34654|nr:phage portal protein [Bacillus cereus group sp. N21]MBJ8026582.1 phage portal protein [Bacillus cereus group sp. N21]